MQMGLCPGPEGFAATWACARRYDPAMDEATRAARYARWQRAVAATLAV
jgi:glycerol kinase